MSTEQTSSMMSRFAKLLNTLVSLLHIRLELLSNDIEEDRARYFRLIVLNIVSAFFLIIGIVLFTLLLVYILWQEHRLYGLFIVAGFFTLVGISLAGYARYMMKHKPRLFSASLLELIKDKDLFDPH